MGGSQSSPAGSTKHVFSSDTPVQFSQELIDSLQASSETNSTRAKTLDLHIQQRVAAELAKLQSAESERLASLKSEIVASSSSPASGASSSRTTTSLLSPSQSKASSENPTSTQSVLSSIEALQQKLDSRKQLKEIPKELERARESLVGCLRVNDRRPLDCWREVEGFKREVRRLEEEFVGGVL